MRSLRLDILFFVLLIVLLAVPCLALSRDDPEVDSKCCAKSLNFEVIYDPSMSSSQSVRLYLNLCCMFDITIKHV